jgi:hypothetical protein
MSCLWTLKLAFSFCQVQDLSHCYSFQTISAIHPASYPNSTRNSFLGSTIAGGWIQPLAFNYCLGPEHVWKFTPMSSLCFCGVVLWHRDKLYFTVIELFFVLYWAIGKSPKGSEVNDTQNFPFTALHSLQSPLVNVKLSLAKVIMFTTSNIHVNRLARYLEGNKRNTLHGKAFNFKGDV